MALQAQLVAVCAVLLLLLLVLECHGWKTPALTPPAGNSLYAKMIIKNGKYVYSCQEGKWVPVLATAQLVNVSNAQQVLGNYSLVYKPNRPYFMGIWYLQNPPEITDEAGDEFSIVAAQVIATEPSNNPSSLRQALAEAIYHQNNGVASQISYIQRLFTKRGLPPNSNPNAKCKLSDTTASVPFSGQFWFYTQDVVPPAMPNSLQCPSQHRVVMGFFCNGFATYAFNGTAWRRTALFGKLYNVPGGNFVGSYYVSRRPDPLGGTFCLETNDPYAWKIVAKLARPHSSVQIQPHSLPWSLFQVTSSTGDTSLLGPFTFFQMLGTRGGLPPSSKNVRVNTTYRAPFCSQFWVYH